MLIGVTGAAGWISRYVTKELNWPQRHFIRSEADQLPGFESVIGDLKDPSALAPFLKGVDALIHFAWSSHPRSPIHTFQRELENNLLATLQLFEAFARDCPQGHLVFVSTGGNMYSDSAPYLPRTERDLPMPRSYYSAQKLSAEAFLAVICRQYHLRATILRISNPYGTLLSEQRTQGLIGVALAKLKERKPLIIVDSLETVRDYIHLSDVALAFASVLRHPPSAGECRLFHVSTGVGHTTAEVLRLIESVTGEQLEREVTAEAEKATPSWSVLSSVKLQAELSWKPNYSLEQGLIQLWSQVVDTTVVSGALN